MRKNILITGEPRSGKSTLLRKLVAEISNKVGFVTNEIIGEGKRIGFEIDTHSGHKMTLANIDFNTGYKVSKYFVDIKNLDVIMPEISTFKSNDLLYLDEIGQMQLFSERFKRMVSKFLDSKNICVSTLSCFYKNDFIETIKNRPDVILVELSPENRHNQEVFTSQLIDKLKKANKYITEPKRFLRNSDGVTLKSEHGDRNLALLDGNWVCSCDFFSQYEICSHAIATEELFGKV